MFSGFTKETSDLFWELCFNNERPWFMAHKQDFEELIYKPFKALAEETAEILTKKNPLFEPALHISRIYRDARRLYGRGPYKENLWFSIKSTNALNENASFFFDLSPSSYAYGMGFYCMKSADMESFRKSVLANPNAFETLALQIDSSPKLIIEGEMYKKPKGDFGETINNWFNRKWVSVIFKDDFGGELFSPDLPKILADTYEFLLPMYTFLTEHSNNII